MEEKTDLRIRKTYAALIDAFLELLKEKSYEDIRVDELCNKAQIRRATFYKHFGDKNEFLVFVIKELKNEFGSQSGREPADLADMLYSTAVSLTDFVKKNERLTYKASQSTMFLFLINAISDEIAYGIYEYCKSEEKRGKVFPVRPVLLAQFYAGAVTRLVMWWTENRSAANEQAFFEEVKKLIKTCASLKEKASPVGDA